jgi:hypothetical protein
MREFMESISARLERIADGLGPTKVGSLQDVLLDIVDDIRTEFLLIETPGRYSGRVEAEPGHLLLGATTLHRSAQFDTYREAEAWAETTAMSNRDADRHVRCWGVSVRPTTVQPGGTNE